MELISLKADFAAKELFAHEKVRKQFLSDTLGIPPEDIKSVRLLSIMPYTVSGTVKGETSQTCGSCISLN